MSASDVALQTVATGFKLKGFAMNTFTQFAPTATPSLSTAHKRSALALNIAALILGPVFGCALIFWQLQTPELQSMSGPIAPGNERTVNVSWPVAAMLDGRVPAMSVEIAASGRIADEVAAVVEMIDPGDPAIRWVLGRFDSLAGTTHDGLVVHRRVFDLGPIVRTTRGVLRRFDVPFIKLIVRAERRSGSRAGFIYLTAADVIAAPDLETGVTSHLTNWTKRR
jgi:hypothetical protein